MCMICGEPILYKNPTTAEICTFCGEEFTCEGMCANGHKVCKGCSDNQAVNLIKSTCLNTRSKNPYEIAIGIMKNPVMRMHDVRHHILVGSALLAAYHNCGGDIKLAESLEEMEKRGKQIPPGACGYLGNCGAAVSSGAFFSIVTGTTPHSENNWSLANTLTGTCLIEMGKLTGPRCCKRDSFIALGTTIDFIADTFEIHMEKPTKLICEFSERNAECIKDKCPYYAKETV